MKRALLVGGFVTVVLAAAAAQEVPFASPRPSLPDSRDIADASSLADIMSVIQWRHIKILYAAQSNNWDLADYNIIQIVDSLRRAANLYSNIPVDYIEAIGKPIIGMKEAAKSKDFSRFLKNYSGATAACNGCHAAAGVGFIKIQTPTSSPFSDQAFGP